MERTELESLVKAGKLTRHHTGWYRGYLSPSNPGVVEEYTGRYGTGYTVRIPASHSRNYSIITYYIAT